MLRITVSKSSAAAAAYFRESLSQEDYYTQKHTVVGKWFGKGALMLGLSGDVKKEDFEALINQHHLHDLILIISSCVTYILVSDDEPSIRPNSSTLTTVG